NVPRQAGGRLALKPKPPLGPAGLPPSTARTGGSWPTSLGGATVPRTVHGLETSGLISGYSSFCLAVGFQAFPVGGPNRAQLLSCRASSVVVNLASSELGAAMTGEVNASLAKATSILPRCFWYSFCQVMSRPWGRKTTLAGLPCTLGIVS